MHAGLTEAPFDDSAALGAPQAISESPWVVMKFGGTSVSTAQNWETIAQLVRSRLDEGLRPVVVHSALGGVSNALVEILDQAMTTDPRPRLEQIRHQHFELARELGLDGAGLLQERMHELEQLIAGVRLVREVSVRVRVRVMALGELMATTLGAAFLEKRGLPARWTDARDLLTSRLRSVSNPARAYLAATCDYEPDAAFERKL